MIMNISVSQAHSLALSPSPSPALPLPYFLSSLFPVFLFSRVAVCFYVKKIPTKTAKEVIGSTGFSEKCFCSNYGDLFFHSGPKKKNEVIPEKVEAQLFSCSYLLPNFFLFVLVFPPVGPQRCAELLPMSLSCVQVEVFIISCCLLSGIEFLHLCPCSLSLGL